MLTPPTLPEYRPCQVPAGRSGDWAILKVELPARATPFDSRPDCFRYRPGRYTELRQAGVTFMTDLHDEWWTQRTAIERARQVGGKVLVTGLGLGLVVEAMLAEPSPSRIEQVLVVERSADVIALVAEHLRTACGERVEIIHADAFSWRPASAIRFDTVWHDIWPDPLAADVDSQIEALRHHHAPWSVWQGFWPEDYRRALANG